MSGIKNYFYRISLFITLSSPIMPANAIKIAPHQNSDAHQTTLTQTTSDRSLIIEDLKQSSTTAQTLIDNLPQQSQEPPSNIDYPELYKVLKSDSASYDNIRHMLNNVANGKPYNKEDIFKAFNNIIGTRKIKTRITNTNAKNGTLGCFIPSNNTINYFLKDEGLKVGMDRLNPSDLKHSTIAHEAEHNDNAYIHIKQQAYDVTYQKQNGKEILIDKKPIEGRFNFEKTIDYSQVPMSAYQHYTLNVLEELAANIAEILQKNQEYKKNTFNGISSCDETCIINAENEVQSLSSNHYTIALKEFATHAHNNFFTKNNLYFGHNGQLFKNLRSANISSTPLPEKEFNKIRTHILTVGGYDFTKHLNLNISVPSEVLTIDKNTQNFSSDAIKYYINNPKNKEFIILEKYDNFNKDYIDLNAQQIYLLRAQKAYIDLIKKEIQKNGGINKFNALKKKQKKEFINNITKKFQQITEINYKSPNNIDCPIISNVNSFNIDFTNQTYTRFLNGNDKKFNTLSKSLWNIEIDGQNINLKNFCTLEDIANANFVKQKLEDIEKYKEKISLYKEKNPNDYSELITLYKNSYKALIEKTIQETNSENNAISTNITNDTNIETYTKRIYEHTITTNNITPPTPQYEDRDTIEYVSIYGKNDNWIKIQFELRKAYETAQKSREERQQLAQNTETMPSPPHQKPTRQQKIPQKIKKQR